MKRYHHGLIISITIALAISYLSQFPLGLCLAATLVFLLAFYIITWRV